MFPGLVRLYNHTSITIHVHSCEMYNMCIYYCYFFKFQRRIQMFSNAHQRHSWSYVSTNNHILIVLFQVISNWLYYFLFVCLEKNAQQTPAWIAPIVRVSRRGTSGVFVKKDSGESTVKTVSCYEILATNLDIDYAKT